MAEHIFEGVGVALVSLFDSDDRLRVSETAEHAASLVERGVAAVTVAGTTGEPWRLDDEDRVALVEACRASLPGDVPAIVGTGHSDPAKARNFAMANAEPERCVKAFGGDLTAQAELASMHLASINVCRGF